MAHDDFESHFQYAMFARLPVVFFTLSLACSSPLPNAIAVGSAKQACTGACLTGLDPYDTGCAVDATTNARVTALDASGRAVAVIELRESERCATSWARVVRVSGANGTLVATVAAAGYSSSFEHVNDGEVWTDMVPVSIACVTATGGVRRQDGLFVNARASSCATP